MADPIDVGSVGRSLPRRLGLKSGLIVLLVGLPEHLVETLLDPDYAWSHVAKDLDDLSPGLPPLDAALVFCRQAEQVGLALNLLYGAFKPQGFSWVAWTEAPAGPGLERPSLEQIRGAAEALGLSGVTEERIDDDWQALKLVPQRASH